MRYVSLLMIMLVSAITLTAYNLPQSLPTVSLPIEVMGPAGTVRSVSLETTGTTDSLYLVGHALGYHNSPALWNGEIQRDGKASFRINGGQWTPISNTTASVRWPERAYLGIGGAYHTVRLALPINATAGLVTIDFRFNGTEGASMGFRIIELDLRQGNTSRLIPGQLIEADPETWTAPVTGDAARGAIAFRQQNSLVESPLPNSPTIIASCADCHAYSGFDLKYYNYSNESIIERSKYHGLSTQTGEDIAAYIRAVDLNRADGRETSPYARPWNPPFQPGPGLTDRGEDDWAAGAGLQWILDSDDETAQWMFPDASGNVPNPNPTNQDISRAVRIGSWAVEDANLPDAWGTRLDFQNIPLAVQFPDWNNWLPDIHPLDAYGANDFMSTELWSRHLEVYQDISSGIGDEIAADRQFFTCTQGCPADGFGDLLRHMSVQNGQQNLPNLLDYTYANNPAEFFLSNLSLQQWQSVKMWELMNVYKLQDLGNEIFGGLVTPSPWIHAGTPLRLVGSRPDQDPPFFWPGQSQAVFSMGPHTNARCGFAECPGGGYPNEGPYGPQGTQVLSVYFSSIWYDVQLILSSENVGIPNNSGGGPIDWPYITAHTRMLQNNNTQISHWWRYFRQRVFANQSRHNWYAQATTRYLYAFNGGPAFTKTSANHWEVIGWYANNTPENRFVGDQALSRRAIQQYMDEYHNFVRSVPLDQWQRGPQAPDSGDHYEPADVVPTAYPGGGELYFWDYWDADNAYRLPALMQAWNMDPLVIDNVARFGESMWPLGNFEQWFVTTELPRGDVTSDGLVNLSDFIATLDIALGINPYVPAADQYPFPNGDGQVDIRDANLIGRAVVTGQWPDGGPVGSLQRPSLDRE